MTTYDWLQLRDHAVELFNGDTPGAELEHRIVNHFTEHPARVAQAIDNIGRKVATGTIRSGWAILARELDAKPAEARAVDNADRAKAIILADAWLLNAGGYIDNQAELEDELFGERGRLKRWPEHRSTIIAKWREMRDAFDAVETESAAHQAHQAALRRSLQHHDQIRDHAQRRTPGDETAPHPGTETSPPTTTLEGPLAQGSDGVALDVQTLAYFDSIADPELVSESSQPT